MFGRKLSAILFVCATMVLSACGGGGGGGDNAQVNINTSPISLSWSEDDSAFGHQAEIPFTATGISSDPVYIYWEDSLNQITALDTMTTSDTQGYFRLNLKHELPAGKHNGIIKLHVCRDSACTRHYPGSPASINYSIHVKTGLKLSVYDLNMAAEVGKTTTAKFDVIPPEGVSTFTINASGGVTASVSGNTVTLTSDAGLYSGAHTPQVLISVPGKTIGIGVHLIVVDPNAPPSGDAKVNTASISLSALEDGLSYTTESIAVTPPTWGFYYAVTRGYILTTFTYEADWIKVTKKTSNVYMISADAKGLAAGDYFGYVCFGDLRFPYIGNDNCTNIKLTVGKGASTGNVRLSKSNVVSGRVQLFRTE